MCILCICLAAGKMNANKSNEDETFIKRMNKQTHKKKKIACYAKDRKRKRMEDWNHKNKYVVFIAHSVRLN